MGMDCPTGQLMTRRKVTCRLPPPPRPPTSSKMRKWLFGPSLRPERQQRHKRTQSMWSCEREQGDPMAGVLIVLKEALHYGGWAISAPEKSLGLTLHMNKFSRDQN